MNIVVLAGGLSSERDVSLATGGQIANALTENGHKVILVDSYAGIDRCDSFEDTFEKYKRDDYSYGIPETEPDLDAIRRQYGDGDALIGKNVLECCRTADAVFIGLHGSIGENGQLQAMFDIFDVTYTGSGYAGCLLSMDKFLAKELMIQNGIPTPPSKLIDISGLTEEELAGELRDMELPYVIKPCGGGSSIGVTIVKSEDDIAGALIYAKTYEDKILVEKFIAGREFSIGVLDGAALPAIEIVPKQAEFFDYSSKYQGTTDEICPADIPEELETALREMALRVHTALRLGSYSRIDFIVDADGNIFCLESNSLPGMTRGSLLPQEARAAGISYGELCETIVNLAIKKV